MATPANRNLLAQYMDLTVAQAARIHYPLGDRRTQSVHQIATVAELMAVLDSPDGLDLDCSQYVELLCHLAGLDDPNGLGYRYDGYTGTILNTCKPHYFKPVSAGIGAIVIFGPGTGEHAAMVRKPGKDPLLASHGGESGPYYISLSDEASYHNNIYTFCPITHL